MTVKIIASVKRKLRNNIKKRSNVNAVMIAALIIWISIIVAGVYLKNLSTQQQYHTTQALQTVTSTDSCSSTNVTAPEETNAQSNASSATNSTSATYQTNLKESNLYLKSPDTVKLESSSTETSRASVRSTRRVTVTAYTAGDDFTPGVIMANGEHVHVGAVAYNDVPLGTKILIDGVQYTVKDRVGSDGVVDIYVNSKREAMQIGRQTKTITILGK